MWLFYCQTGGYTTLFFFSFWLRSLCTTVSKSTHVSISNSISFFLIIVVAKLCLTPCDSWTYHSSFLCNIALYSIGPCFYHQSHPQLGIEHWWLMVEFSHATREARVRFLANGNCNRECKNWERYHPCSQRICWQVKVKFTLCFNPR